MSIKRKLGMGAASAALGLSLIGGGTWAAFNDMTRQQLITICDDLLKYKNVMELRQYI
ncbi:MAG: M73 family metallopeptidase, partial [Bacillus sp. (in: Bacteria)]|nr:M73 family metallopeptidase [Bacillus sp. (in: firmicutes)]